MDTPSPDASENASTSPIGISLGRLQKLEDEFRQHRDFWSGQAPYMRIILETTQALNQGLLNAVAALDRRQGKAVDQLSDRIDHLIKKNLNNPFDTLPEQIQEMRKELAMISQRQDDIAKDTADLLKLVYGLRDINRKG
ncbi:hypothetical protein HF283_00065 [Acidithiobacillus ferrooxidans]|uniref:hypothetical protein n=1 Tax=Acidithiobacillus ferridurans TaxID=1232575 RepID=UPI001C06962D|nr:hypothetical protein [Acidithiobacillus ferridurans]MBU2806592.1 hypothetical protein [Acidithiobacillus ferridurans]MBU2822516.1 hypothetical protein [Acidithiobacillus ferrooxidans]